MDISVVMPVLNEEKYIRDCLHSILDNTVLPKEIIVCDGGSVDRTVEIVKEFPNIIILDNVHKTAASGRNIGIEHASGEIIAFTDGDCYVDNTWIEQIQQCFSSKDIDGLRGKITPAESGNRYEIFWNNVALNVVMTFDNVPRRIMSKSVKECLVTANCAYKREALLKLNGFDIWFGNNAEDTDLSWRALGSQLFLYYQPSVKVYAHGATTLRSIRQKSFRNGVSSSKLQKRHGKRINFDVNLYKMLIRNFIGLFMRTPDAGLNLFGLTWHLLGKYYGSIKVWVINL